MNIYWKKQEGGATSEFAEIEDYIDESVTVWFPNPRKKDEQWIYPGNGEKSHCEIWFRNVIVIGKNSIFWSTFIGKSGTRKKYGQII